MEKKIDSYLDNLQHTLSSIDRGKVADFTRELLAVRQRGGAIYIFGNGGSGATASHFCGDVLKGVSHGLDKRFKILCLNDNSPAVLAIANDLCYEDIFVEQLKNFLHKDDLVIGISGSGNSENVLRAIQYANSKEARTFGLCGFDGGKLKEIANDSLHIDIQDMEITEDVHTCFLHCTKMVLMDQLKDDYTPRGKEKYGGCSVIACKYCGNEDMFKFLSIGNTPLANSNISEQQLRVDTEKTYPLDIYYCEKCGLCQVGVDVPPDKIFTDYIFFSSTSDWAKQYSKELARHINEKFNLPSGSFVVEIASNDGCYLKSFKELGNKVLGVEPAKNIAKVAIRDGIETYNDFFGEGTSKKISAQYGEADFVLAMNVFPHVPDPHDFVKGLKNLIKKRGIIAVHSHYLVDLIKNMSFDTFYHEHYTYISARPVQYIFNKYGMEIFDIELRDIYCGSAIYYIGNIGEHHVSSNVRKQMELELSMGLGKKETFFDFGKRAEQIKEKLTELIRNLKAKGKTIAGYGAAAKANTLLNYCGIDSTMIDFIADKSEHKQGLFTPGSHIPIVHPLEILAKMPDYLIILAWNFGTEIIEQQSEYHRRGGKFIVGLPEPAIISIDESKEKREIVPGLIVQGVVEYE